MGTLVRDFSPFLAALIAGPENNSRFSVSIMERKATYLRESDFAMILNEEALNRSSTVSSILF